MKINRKYIFVILFLVIFLAFFLRFRELGKNPPGINLDEASIGWNAYSVLKTGKDEYGQLFPLAFRSLDDYKPPLYIYLTVPAIALFDLNEFSVRLPSAILGVGAVVALYFLVKELFRDEPNLSIALLAGFLLAISPWHLQFTRTAYETGSLALFSTCGLLFFLKGLREGKKFLILSAVFFALELYLYQAAKVFIPFFVISLLIIYIRQLKAKLSGAAVFLIVFAVFALPVGYSWFAQNGQLRFQGTSIFLDPKPHEVNLAYKTTDWLRNDRISAALFHPEQLEFFQRIARGYASHLSLAFLYLGGDGARVNYVNNFGLEYLWELPFFLAGWYYLWRNHHKKPAFLLSAWFLLAPVPAAPTVNLPSSVRTAVMLPVLQIVTAYGLVYLLMSIRKEYPRFIPYLVLSLAAAVTLSLIIYLHMMFIHAPVENSRIWYSGYREIIDNTYKLAPNYRRVLVSNKLDQTLDFFLFFLKYDPKVFLDRDGGRISGGFDENDNRLANIYFKRDLFYNEERKVPGTLFVGAPGDFPADFRNPIKKFNFLNGEPSAYIVEGDL